MGVMNSLRNSWDCFWQSICVIAKSNKPSLVGLGGLGKGAFMNNIFYIIGVVVVVLFILGYLGLR